MPNIYIRFPSAAAETEKVEDTDHHGSNTSSSCTLIVSTSVSAKSDTLRDAAVAAARYAMQHVHDDSHCVCVLPHHEDGAEGAPDVMDESRHHHHQQPMCSLGSEIVKTTLASKGQIWVAATEK